MPEPRAASLPTAAAVWPSLPGLIGSSAAMQRLQQQIRRVAPTEASVLIIGESGTGKEAVAQALHALSARAGGPFVAVNCGAIAPSLIESELLGHEKGSFTGADRQRPGYFERAHGGTIFLDEVTEMPLPMQVKLLRVLESRSFQRVGGDRAIDVDIRVIAATNRALDRAIADGGFREDLMYRLAVVPLRVPSLRERGTDIAELAHHFLDALNAGQPQAKKLAPLWLQQLQARDWPGNVRELKNVISRAYILTDQRLSDASALRIATPAIRPMPADGALEFSVGTPIATVERAMLFSALDQHAGSRHRAARTLGISVKTLYNKMESYRQSDT